MFAEQILLSEVREKGVEMIPIKSEHIVPPPVPQPELWRYTVEMMENERVYLICLLQAGASHFAVQHPAKQLATEFIGMLREGKE